MHISLGGGCMYFSGGYIPYKILDVHVIYMYSVYIHIIFCQKNNTPRFRNIVVHTPLRCDFACNMEYHHSK